MGSTIQSRFPLLIGTIHNEFLPYRRTLLCLGPKYLVDYGNLRMVISLRPILGMSSTNTDGSTGTLGKNMENEESSLGMNGLYMIFTYYIIASAKLLGHGRVTPATSRRARASIHIKRRII